MNRKKFITTLSVLGVGSVVSYYGFQFAKTKGTPDFNFLDNNKTLLAELCETIIPKTNTPGAKEAMAHEFVIYSLKHSKEESLVNNFINGLKDVQSYSNSKFNMAFTQLNKQQQIEVVLHFKEIGKNFSGSMGKVRNKILGKSFYSILKEKATVGYCTSMIGAKQGLSYEYVPTRFIGCTNLLPGQKSWATK
jgi:hypothetical protein